MRPWFGILTAVMTGLGPVGGGAAAKGAWKAVANKPGCVVWDDDPEPGVSVTWYGVCADGKTTGLGSLQWRNATETQRGQFRSYIGHMKAGRYHGDGAFLMGRGSRYDGTWKDGLRHGYGIYRWADGTRYEGEWRDGKQHGHGVLEEPGDYRYEGTWKNGQPDGQGTETIACGGRYVGGWKEGRRHGRGNLTLPGEGTCTGEWRHGNLLRGTGTGRACFN